MGYIDKALKAFGKWAKRTGHKIPEECKPSELRDSNRVLVMGQFVKEDEIELVCYGDKILRKYRILPDGHIRAIR